MTDLPILNRERLDLITRGDAALADEFLSTLFVEADALLEQLRTSIGNDDCEAVADVAHTFKGMAAELGAARLQAVAAALEGIAEPARWSEYVERLAAAVTELRLSVLPQT
jgi:HPt (histidine-containing phosphotransfer) domain-containing protein